jgi:hypothetical protein
VKPYCYLTANLGLAGSPQKKASSDEREDANDYADGHACEKTSVVKILGGSTHKIPMQQVSEGQRSEQHCNSAQKVKNPHVVCLCVGYLTVTL